MWVGDGEILPGHSGPPSPQNKETADRHPREQRNNRPLAEKRELWWRCRGVGGGGAAWWGLGETGGRGEWVGGWVDGWVGCVRGVGGGVCRAGRRGLGGGIRPSLRCSQAGVAGLLPGSRLHLVVIVVVLAVVVLVVMVGVASVVELAFFIGV